MIRKFQKIFLLFFFLFTASGCSPSSLSDLRYEAKKEMKLLGEELKSLEDKESVENHFRSLEKRFKKIAQLMILTKNFPSDGEEEEMKEAEIVFRELARLYEVPGVQEIVEGAQKEAIQLLDRSFSKREGVGTSF